MEHSNILYCLKMFSSLFIHLSFIFTVKVLNHYKKKKKNQGEHLGRLYILILNCFLIKIFLMCVALKVAFIPTYALVIFYFLLMTTLHIRMSEKKGNLIQRRQDNIITKFLPTNADRF
jgi:cobalamin biosynthesis protein CobD/CbiB